MGSRVELRSMADYQLLRKIGPENIVLIFLLFVKIDAKIQSLIDMPHEQVICRGNPTY